MVELENFKTDLVTKLAWMLGVKEEFLKSENSTFNQLVLEEIKKDNNANIIRAISILRMDLLRNYNVIFEKQNNLVPLDQMDEETIHVSAIKFLRKNNIEVVQANRNTTMYVAYLNQFMLENIDKIKYLIPTWTKWDYIRNLFLMPECYSGHNGANITTKYDQGKIAKKIHSIKNTYTLNLAFYPFATFLNWPTNKMSATYGNILLNDAKFLNILYSINGDTFSAETYVIDAKKDDKDSIYTFVEESKNICIFVDCENVDPYIFVSLFKNLNKENLVKIKKIVLIDDVHTCYAWNLIKTEIDIPIQHETVERVLDHKSLVDINLASLVCKEYYENSVESIVLCSSDSDFWGLIKTLPKARFYVLNESDKTSPIILEKLDEKNIKHCFMDSFAQASVHKFKETILKKTLQRKIDRFNYEGILDTLSPNEFVTRIFAECRIRGSEEQIEKEKKEFFDRYLKKGFRIKIAKDKNGEEKFKLEIVE